MKLLFLLLISCVIFPVYLPDVLCGAEPGVLYSCCLVCQHDPCLCSMQFDDMPFDEMVTSEIPSTDAQQQPMQGKRYQCTYPGCKAICKSSSSLRIHGRIHTGEKPYKCQHPGCGYASAYSSHLTNHERIHTGERPYKCPHPGCGRAFTQSNELTVHKRTHTGEKPYTCTWDGCGRAFAQLGHLTRHMCTHTGEKSYKCNSCEGKYLQFFQLRRHLKRIHGIEIPPKKGGRPPKRTQKNLDNDKAGAPEDQEARQAYLDMAVDLLETYDETLQRGLHDETGAPEDQEAKRVHRGDL